MSREHRAGMYACLIAAALHAGCAAAPDTRPLYQAPERVATLGRIGFVTGHFAPAQETRFDPEAKGHIWSTGPGPFVDPRIVAPVFASMLLLSPFWYTEAAQDEAARGRAHVAAEAGVKDVLDSRSVQDGLAKAVLRYAAEQRLNLAPLPERAGPADAAASPDYRDASPGQVDTVLEVSALKVSASGVAASGRVLAFLEIPVRVRLVAVRDKRVLDSYAYTYRSRPRTPAEWSADGAKAFDEALGRAYREIAEEIVDESLLIRRHPTSKDSEGPLSGQWTMVKQLSRISHVAQARPGSELVPDYVLQPLAPHASRAIRGGLTQRAKVDTFHPTLSWEPLPDSHASQPAVPVTYEVRLFDSETWPAGALYAPRTVDLQDAEPVLPRAEIYRRAGLTGTEHRIETELQPCKVYYWSVRARYELDGRPWVTEWSGAYKTIDGENTPWLWRRSAQQPSHFQQPNSFSFLPFETPRGDECETQPETAHAGD